MAALGPEYFEPEIFAARARDRLPGSPPDARSSPATSLPHGDHVLARLKPDPAALNGAKRAAVLIPIIARPEGATVLLTQRADGMRNHSGQIAFPGGRIDPQDDGPLRAALREAFEEIGLPRQAVQPLGFMPPYLSVTGYHITPVVALVEPDMPIDLNTLEVTETFEVPLHFLMDPRNHNIEARDIAGTMRRYYAISYGDRYIWGVTAGIIRQMYERLYA